MTFGEVLRAESTSRSVAFLEYVQQRGRFPEHLFVFVEERDDVRFYDHFTVNVPKKVFFATGSKTEVIEICRRIEESPAAITGRTAFIVDRDLDEGEAPVFVDTVLRTSGYSWESHAADDDVLRRVLMGLVLPPYTVAAAEDAVAFWANTRLAFRTLLLDQSAAISLSSERGGGRNFGDWPLTEAALTLADRVEPGADATAWLAQKIDELVAAGCTPAELELRARSFVGDVLRFAHGRTLFRLFRRVMALLLGQSGSGPIIEINSPLAVVTTMPNDWQALDYVREYLARRIAA